MSTIKANKFQTLDGLTYNVPIQVVTSSLGAANLGTTTSSTSDQTNGNASYAIGSTSTTWTDTSNLQLTITPKFASSIIKLELNVYTYSPSSNSAGIRVRRGTSIIFRPALGPLGPYGNGYWVNSDCHNMNNWQFFDSPNTTSAITYVIQYRAYSSSSACRWFAFNVADSYGPANWFTATEIAQ